MVQFSHWWHIAARLSASTERTPWDRVSWDMDLQQLSELVEDKYPR